MAFSSDDRRAESKDREQQWVEVQIKVSHSIALASSAGNMFVVVTMLFVLCYFVKSAYSGSSKSIPRP